MPLSQKVDQYCNQEKMYFFEGKRGVKHLTKLIRVLEYNSLIEFFEDNSGAIISVIEWIGSQNNSNWETIITAELIAVEDDDNS